MIKLFYVKDFTKVRIIDKNQNKYCKRDNFIKEKYKIVPKINYSICNKIQKKQQDI